MIKKILIVLVGAAGALALLPAVNAFASHPIGGSAKSCFYRQSTAYNGVEVAVEGRGSDVPANRLIAARARVSSAAACNRRGGVAVTRVQIDRLALLNSSSVLREGGPYSNGSAYVLGDAPGYSNSGIKCTMNLRVYVHFSARYSDGSLGGGGFYGPSFRKPGC